MYILGGVAAAGVGLYFMTRKSASSAPQNAQTKAQLQGKALPQTTNAPKTSPTSPLPTQPGDGGPVSKILLSSGVIAKIVPSLATWAGASAPGETTPAPTASSSPESSWLPGLPSSIPGAGDLGGYAQQAEGYVQQAEGYAQQAEGYAQQAEGAGGDLMKGAESAAGDALGSLGIDL
jgi:uncharacterized protein YjbJ (UPF0337 family)